MVREPHHERDGDAPKFKDLAVRPEALEGRTAIFSHTLSGQLLRLSRQSIRRPTGKMNLEDVQEFLDAAYENGQIQQKANSRALMDYGPLDDVLKTKPAK